MKLINTGKRIHCEFGRSGGDFKCTRTIYRDDNGVEYIKHKRFVNGIASLDVLYPHMLNYSFVS